MNQEMIMPTLEIYSSTNGKLLGTALHNIIMLQLTKSKDTWDPRPCACDIMPLLPLIC